MTKYQRGDKVTNVNSKEKGVIVDVRPGGRGRQLYRVRYGNEEKDSLETNLIFDTDITDPFECCIKGLFSSYLDFSRINTTFKIHNTSNNTISSLKASRTLFKAYQFKPLLKFLNSPNRRLLIADEVGLGKTIEAGHIMMELAARKELRNVLVICTKMLKEKWKNELKEKFNLNFKVYERKRDLVDDLKSGIVKGIINYEFIQSKIKNKEEINPFLKLIIEENTKFDLVLCDEAHKLKNNNTQTYKGAKIIIPYSISTIFMTATPIMISEENLFNLLYLLDSQQFNNIEIFQTYLAINRPFIKAISALNKNVDLKKIANELSNSNLIIHYGKNIAFDKSVTVNDIFKNIPLYVKIIENLTTQPDTIENRVQLQFDISSMSMMNNIFSRTRKREVTTDWTQPVRKPHLRKVEFSQEEKEKYDKIIDEYYDDHSYIDEYGDSKLSQGHGLGLIQKKRRIASSIYGFLNDTESLDRGIDKYENYSDAKYKMLLTIIKDIVDANSKKIIVFALFKNTLKYLRIRLHKDGYNSAVIHGDIQERDEVIKTFRTKKNVNILLSSEVGSEGLDFQFCDALVNYDLPWNPMVVEQRIGRIDRIGQKSQIINIYNLIVKGSIQEKIYERLLKRIGIFRSSIGDLEAILEKETEGGTIQKRIIKLEKELYCTKLSEEDEAEKIENISRAILHEKRHLEEISEGLTDTLTNDTYFKNEIQKIQKNYRYITEHELYNYIQSLIRNYLTECTLKAAEDNVYKFSIPLANKNYLINFLNRYQPNYNETELLFRQFINSIRDKHEFELTFNQELAYNNQDLIFVNAYHPLIIAAKECFRQNLKESNTAFQFGINKKRFNDFPQIKCGEYFLAIYTIYITKKWFGKEQTNELLVPIVFDIQTKSIIENKDLSERFLGESQLYATFNQMPLSPDKVIIDILREDIAYRIDVIYQDYLEDQKMRLETSKAIQIQRTEEFYNNRINEEKQNISNIEFSANYAITEEEKARFLRILPARRGTLKGIIAMKDDAIQKINESKISTKEPKLISLSQIKVY